MEIDIIYSRLEMFFHFSTISLFSGVFFLVMCSVAINPLSE